MAEAKASTGVIPDLLVSVDEAKGRPDDRGREVMLSGDRERSREVGDGAVRIAVDVRLYRRHF